MSRSWRRRWLSRRSRLSSSRSALGAGRTAVAALTAIALRLADPVRDRLSVRLELARKILRGSPRSDQLHHLPSELRRGWIERRGENPTGAAVFPGIQTPPPRRGTGTRVSFQLSTGYDSLRRLTGARDQTRRQGVHAGYAWRSARGPDRSPRRCARPSCGPTRRAPGRPDGMSPIRSAEMAEAPWVDGRERGRRAGLHGLPGRLEYVKFMLQSCWPTIISGSGETASAPSARGRGHAEPA